MYPSKCNVRRKVSSAVLSILVCVQLHVYVSNLIVVITVRFPARGVRWGMHADTLTCTEIIYYINPIKRKL